MRSPASACRRFFPSVFTALVLVAGAASASAQTIYTWTGGGSDDNWGTAANWSPGPVGSGNGTVLVFSGSTRTSPNNNFNDWNFILGRLEFASGAAPFTLTGNNIGFNRYLDNQKQEIFQNSVNTQTIGWNAFSFQPGTDSQINLNAGDLVISSGNIYIDSDGSNIRSLYVTGNDTTRRTVTLAGNLNKNGGGDPDIYIQSNKRLLVNGSITTGAGNDGSIFIDDGVLEFGSTGGMTGGSPVVGNTSGSGTAAVYLNSAGSTFARQIEIRGGSSGPRIVGGLNTSGTATFSGNFIATNSPADYDLKAATGGTVVVSGQRNVAGTLQVNRADGATTFGGTVEISSTATGGSTTTVVNAGTLRVRDLVGDGWGVLRGSVTVNAGAQLDLVGSGAALGWQSGGRVTSLSLAAGSLVNANTQHIWLGGGTVSLTAATMQTNGGVSSPTGDYFEWGDSPVATAASSGTSVISGRMNLRGDALSGRILNFTVADGAAATDLLVSAAITESTGASGTAGIAKYGAGTMKLTGSNSFTNQSLIYAGTLEVDSLAQLGTNSVEFNAASGDSGTLRYVGATGSSSQNLWIDNAGLTRAAIDVSQAGTTLTWTPAGGTVNRNLTKVGAGTLSFGGQISGSATVGVEAGTLVLTASNSYTGPTTVSAGRLQVNSSNGITSGTITLGDANTGASDTSLFIDATTAAATVSRPIVIANQGSGTATLGSASTSGTNIAAFSGAVSLGKDVFLNGGTTGDRLGFTGGISGTGNVTVGGANRVLFSGAANTYSGSTAILAGATLQLADGVASSTSFIPDASDVNVAGTLNIAKGGNSEAINGLSGSGTVQAFFSNNTLAVGGAGGSGTFSGVLGQITGTLSVVKQGAGTQVLTGANTYTGSTSLAGGTLGAGSAGALGSGGTISFDGGTLAYYSSNTTDYSGRFSTAANQAYSIDTNGNSVTLATALTSVGGSLTKLGSGALTLAGTNSYDGGTTVSAGRLVGTTSTSFPGNIVNNAEVEFVTTSGNYNYSGVMSGTGTLIKSGGDELGLDGANSYSGGTTVTAGALSGTPDSLQGPIANSGVVAFATDGSGAYAGVISGTGAIEVRGGDIAFTGTSVYTGATTVWGGGRLSVNGGLGNTAVTVQGGGALGGSGSIGGPVVVDGLGTLSPGNSIASLAVGATTFTGTSELVGGSTFEYEYDSSAALSVGADLLVVSGSLTIGDGSLITFADLAGSPTPFADGTIFALINYSGAWNNGLFTYNTTPLTDGSRFFVGSQEWEIDYNRTSTTGLANYTGDYLPSSSFVAITAVPEPATWAMALTGLAAGGLMIRRRSRS